MQIQHTIKENGFITNITIHSVSSDPRLSATIYMPHNQAVFVKGQVVRKEGEYLPVIEIAGGTFEGKEAFYHSNAAAYTFKQMEWFASDLNAFERDSKNYARQIQEYLDERSVEGLSLYLPLFPVSMTDDGAKQVLAMIANSGQFGSLTTTADVGKLDMSLFKSLIVLAESIDGIYVADEAPFTSMAQIMAGILEADHA